MIPAGLSMLLSGSLPVASQHSMLNDDSLPALIGNEGMLLDFSARFWFAKPLQIA